MQHRNLQSRAVATTRPMNVLGRGFLVLVLLFTGLIPQFSGVALPLAGTGTGLPTASANSTYFPLSSGDLAQDWTTTSLITTDDVWTNVPSIEGFRGDNLTAATGVDPQTLTQDDTTPVLDVNANKTDPVTFNTGGVTEFELTNPTIALAGSGTADAPYILIYLNTTGRQNINISYKVRDIEAGVDDAIQQVALHYRVGTVGSFTNLPTGYVADATTAGQATLVTNVNVTLPAAANDQTQVQVRIMTSNANGNDEAVGIDDILVTSQPFNVAPALNVNPSSLNFTALTGGANPPSQNVTVTSVPGPISYTVAVSSSGWLAASSSNGQAPDSLTVTATTGVLAPGQYSGLITLTGVLTPSIVKTVPVNFTVNSNIPMLIATPGQLGFAAVQGGANPASQLINVGATVGNPNFTVAVSSTGWLSASPSGGTAPAAVTVSATTGSLTAGTYNGVVTLTNTTTPGDVKAVPVTFTINATQTYTPVNQIQKTTGQPGQWKSQLTGQLVTTEGVVTVKVSNGFWIQEPNPDGDLNTSEGVFVFTTNTAYLTTAQVGNRVRVGGTVTEYKQSTPTACADANKPTITEVSFLTSVTDLGAATPIAPTIVSYNRTGTNIRQIPTQSVFTTPEPNQETDGIDFWESLEGMYVQVDDALVVGPTDTNGTSYHTLVVLADNGVGATTLNARKGIPLQPTDYNPERLQVLLPIAGPYVSSGDKFTVPLKGTIDIDCFTTPTLKLAGTAPTPANIDTSGRPAREVNPALTNANHLRTVAFNVENLDPSDPQAKFDLLGSQIINNLGAPDIISLSEVQDNNGATNDGTVNSDVTLNKLRAAVFAASSNTISYTYVYIAPIDGTNGGEPGGNIRPVLFYRTDRGVTFTSRPGGDATTANDVLPDGSLKYSPGLLDPTNAAFADSRKPLAGEFMFKGQKIIVIANHWNSKGGDSGTYSVVQPPVLGSQAKRVQQATIVRNFVNAVQAANPTAYIVLNGDFNDFEFSLPLQTVKAGPTPAGNLLDGNETIPLSEDRYTYRYEGNAQSLDHALYTLALSSRVLGVNATHINADYATNDPLRSSDHDPVVVNFDFTPGGIPDLTIAKSHTGNFTVNVAATYTIAVTNTGTSATNGLVTVTDTLPSGLTFTSISGPGWTCSSNGQVVTCTATSPIASNAALTLSLLVTPTLAGTVTNTATVAGGGESNTTNNLAQDVTIINGIPCAPEVVTSPSDNGQGNNCGTLSYALLNTATNGTITFQLTQGSTISFTGSLTPTVKVGLTINGGANGIQLWGNGVAGNGLVLAGNNTLQDLTVRGFAGHQLVASTVGNKVFRSKFYD